MNSQEFLKHLQSQKILNDLDAERVAIASSKAAVSVEKSILELGLAPEDRLFEELAAFMNLPFVREEDINPDLYVSLELTQSFLQRMEIIPAYKTDMALIVATSHPQARDVVAAVGYEVGMNVEMAIATPSSIKSVLSQTTTPFSNGSESSEDDIERLNHLANDGPVIALVNDVIAEAVRLGASDIHIEASSRVMKVRFRIDGLLQNNVPIPRGQSTAVVSRLKIMANLNISEKRRPQDGRFQVSVRGRSVDVRISTLPTQFGESVVLRLLDQNNLSLNWQQLGFATKTSNCVRNLVQKPNGIFLVAGPTGSGKTTTLYTALSELNTPDRKILTVEDPIEYSLDGINQVQVQSDIDMGFPEALRAMLRQDPDVIMVGEIRDAETAEIAVRAALVGRMVLSTIHTNDSISAIPRLLDLGIPKYLLAATLRGVLSQRLVRRLCPDCHGDGCDVCGQTGTKGRTALTELLEISPALSQSITEFTDVTKLRHVAKRDGFIDFEGNATALIRDGIASESEVNGTI